SACAPITSVRGQFLGALGIVIKAEYFADLVSARKIGATGYGYMMNKQGIILAHPVRDHILKLDVNTIAELAAINQR
ncbi:cache domain-containing protein, partial [Klebsiella pneumoniae]|uniref:cache domain-containing protein n=1 Tax=Klebsiella pneumoniae TaxID=573 RepID=UPI00272F509D